MSAGSADSDDSGFGINVTPLVDVTLVLLVIFMVTTRLSEPSQLAMQLPKAAAAEAPTVTGVEVQLAKDGTRTMNAVPADDDAVLLAQAQRALAANPNVHAAIAADEGVNHGRVMRTLGVLKRAGLSKIAFAVNDEAAPAP